MKHPVWDRILILLCALIALGCAAGVVALLIGKISFVEYGECPSYSTYCRAEFRWKYKSGKTDLGHLHGKSGEVSKRTEIEKYCSVRYWILGKYEAFGLMSAENGYEEETPCLHEKISSI